MPNNRALEANFLLCACGHDGFRHVARRLAVVLEFHRVGGTALRHGAQRGGVAEHFRQGHFGLDDLAATNHVVHALHHAATAGQVTHHVAGVVFWGFHFHGHHGFQDDGIGFAGGFLETKDGSHLERLLGRVHVVVGTEGQRDLHVHHREAGQHTAVECFDHALFHRRDVLARHYTTLDFVQELETLAGFVGLQAEHHVAVLALAARLAHELAVHIGHRLAHGFAVGHLGLAHVGFHTELALHAVHDDFQVQLAHAGNDGLAGFLIGPHAERWVFRSQARQGDTHLFLIGLGLGLHGLRDHGLGEHHALKHDGRSHVAQRFAGGHFLQTHAGGDVAGADFVHFHALVGHHLHDTADTLLLALDRVVHGVAFGQHAGVHTPEGQLADEGVGHQLERQSRALLVVVGRAALRLLVFVRPRHIGNIGRRRQVVDHGIQHALHALVLECGTTQHRVDFGGDGALTQARL